MRILRSFCSSLIAFLLFLAAPMLVAAGGHPPSDFFGNGTSDLLWRNDTTGQVYLMPMNGGTPGPGAVIWTEPNSAWVILGTGDFDGDGKADILWRNNTTGQVCLMLMDGTTVKSSSIVYTEPNEDWSIQAAADFYGNGKADLLWRNRTTGQVYLMPMNGTTVLPGAVIWTEPDPAWQIVGTGDFDGDGKADILWWNRSTGQVCVMLMNGGSVKSSSIIYTEPNTAWQIVGTGDFNGDGKVDILWRNSATGQVYVMLMNGTSVLSGAVIWTEPDLAWEITTIGDFNGDGKSDIVWHNSSTGQVYEMLMNGLSISSSGIIHNEPDTAWILQGQTHLMGSFSTPNVSPDQYAFEQFILSPNVSYSFNWHMVTSGMPTAGVYWLGQTTATMAASPLTSGPQTIQNTPLADITATPLGFPAAAQYYSPYHPNRYLIGSSIVVSSNPPSAKSINTYPGTAVRQDILDAGGTTVVASYLRSGATVNALSGTVVSAPTDLNHWFNSLFYDSSLLNPSTTWSPGSKYLKYTETQLGDCYRVFDWSTTVITTGTTPIVVKTGSSISTQITATTGFTSTTDGITYTLANGSISTINGIPTYVASVARPNQTTTTYHTFYDLNGNIYSGELIRNGTVIGGNVYQDSGGTKYDQNYQIRLNAAAAASLKSALTF